MTTARDHLTKADTVTIAAIEAGVPLLVEARALIDSFHAMIRKKVADDLEPWIVGASKSLVASFANGITRDHAAVRAGDHRALVQRPDRGTDHQAQARQAPDVRTREARPPASQADRCCMTSNFIESDGVERPFEAASKMPNVLVLNATKRRSRSMDKITTIGLDLAEIDLSNPRHCR